jgi:ketosteroid isomerase-like protein
MSSLFSTIESFWRVFESGDVDRALADHVTPDVEFVMPGMPALRGIDRVRPLWAAYREAFPDFRHETVLAVERDGTYAAETRYSGTHSGVLLTPMGEVGPTGKRIEWQSADVVQFRNGRIAVWHVYHDTIPFLSQLGLMAGGAT